MDEELQIVYGPPPEDVETLTVDDGNDSTELLSCE
jgi:hypothetical protein